MYTWILNPVAIVTFIVSLVLFIKERKIPEAKNAVGKKGILIYKNLIATAVFYITAGVFTVVLTGGI